ncbi:hypothetical protein J7M28_04260 [bacterium]|nr:hypothetical protein [bacterium]
MQPGEAQWSYWITQGLAYILITMFIGRVVYFLIRRRHVSTRELRIFAPFVILEGVLIESRLPAGVAPFEASFWSHIRPPLWHLVTDYPSSIPMIITWTGILSYLVVLSIRKRKARARSEMQAPDADGTG